jgi:hypothetical protein
MMPVHTHVPRCTLEDTTMIDLAPMIVLLAAVAGVVLLWLGVRGRRLNEHPACRRCGFDLLGVFPGGANCPECGAPLGGRRAVRTGVRQRRRSLVVIGGGLVGVVLLVFATGVWFMFAGPSLNAYKPSFFLVLEGRYSDAAASRAAAKELLSRQTDGSLSDRQVAWAVSGALALQADTESVWVGEWGDLVERARAAGKVSDADYERFLRQSAVLALVARPGAARGETIPLAIGVVEWRCANTPALDLGVWVDEFRINDAIVEWADYGGKRLALTNAEHPIQLALTGRAPGMRAASRTHADTMGLELDPLATVPPSAAAAGTGVVTLRARVGCSGGARPGAMGRSAADWRLLEPGVTLRARVALDGPAPTPRRVNDATRSRVAAFLGASRLEVVDSSRTGWGDEDDERTRQVRISIPRTDPPAPIAADVFLVRAGTAYKAGTFTTGLVPRDGWLALSPDGALDTAVSTVLTLSVPLADLVATPGEKWRLIFTPNPSLAGRTLDLDAIFDEEVRVDVETGLP